MYNNCSDYIIIEYRDMDIEELKKLTIMSNDYDNITAYHYSVYRPALHLPILESCLEGKYFEKGLDIGCGTGHSSIALANFCNEIVGLDPSSDMLNKTIFDKKVNYLHWDEKNYLFLIFILKSLH